MSWQPLSPPPPVPAVGKTGVEGGTLGTFPTPSVTHRKLSISQPVAQGPKGAKFSVACVRSGPGQQEVSGG